MNRILIGAAILNLAVAVVHIFVGETEIVAPLLASDAPDLVKATLQSAWHMISVVLLLSTLALFRAGLGGGGGRDDGSLPRFLGLQYVALALVFVVASLVYGQVFIQVLMLLPIGLLSLWAGRAARRG